MALLVLPALITFAVSAGHAVFMYLLIMQFFLECKCVVVLCICLMSPAMLGLCTCKLDSVKLNIVGVLLF